MKEKWINLNKLNKSAIILLILVLLIMILGLILIGVAGVPKRQQNLPPFTITIPSQNGFDILKIYSIGKVLSHSASYAHWTNGAWITLQLGCTLSAIITPILFATVFGIFGYSFYLNKKNK